MKVILAPMEGLADYWVRRAMTAVAQYDWCVTEFIRVSGTLLPPRVFYRWCPELQAGARTSSGTPVHVQLLGSDPNCVAENAAHAVELGAPAIDLNFGCPAKTVNKHRGGAALLDEPELVNQVVCRVRRTIAAHVPVSAKMRLGNGDSAHRLDNAQAIADAGASWLTVHARTRAQGYRPPAYWEAIAELSEAVTIPIIANGEIWTVQDAASCQSQSGCSDLMLGRGAVSNPWLAGQLRGASTPQPWLNVRELMLNYIDAMQGSGTQKQLSGRVKQWLNYLRRHWPEAEAALANVRRYQDTQAMRTAIAGIQENRKAT
jgi:tRNA-dihydrouridine synthase C